MRRFSRFGLMPPFVLATTVAVAIAMAVVVHGVVSDQESRLLHERGAEVATTLRTSVTNIESSLPLLARVAELDRTAGKTQFGDAARPLLTGSVLALGTVGKHGDTLRVTAAAGAGPRTGDTLQGQRAALIRRAFATRKLVTALVADQGRLRIDIAKRGRVFAAYQETPVDPAQPIASAAGSPFNGVNVALYAAPRPDPSKLALTSTGRARMSGTVDRRILRAGADRWLVLTSTQRALAGQFATQLPWFILGGGLLVSLLLTALVMLLAHRRQYALALVDARTVELREARAVAEAANLAKSEFLSRMSHELRTPLNAILGFAQLLELDGLEPDQQQSVDHVMKGGRHLLELVDEILDISRIESGNTTISVEPVEVASALGDVLRLVGPLASEAQIELSSELPAADEAYVLADRMRLRQVLLNVLSNAVKYNREGGWVRVSVAVEPEGRLQIRVADSGPGVPAGKEDLLFMPFERLGAELGPTEGTGLGLALSKGLMERMGGSIRAENAAEGGAVFTLELKAVENRVSPEALDAARAAGEHEPQFGPCTILYIEDNLSNFQLVERVLAPQRAVRLIPAMQGGLGIELAERHRPDLILLDLHLPDIPGAAIFERLRSSPTTRDVPIVVISADATDRQVRRLLDAGADDYLTKPLDLRRFLELVRRYARSVAGALR
jgi:signal transduction histidine kinase/ActR/RegA family two-component response regulator